MKKPIKILSLLIVSSIFMFMAFASGGNDSKNDESSKKIDCTNNDSYHDGYSAGKLCKAMGDGSSCDSYVQSYNNSLGRNVLTASDCYCEGFNDGQSGEEEKYK